jgi:ABC-type Fe2+-enterobactin transport system substrate-binding protein
MRAVFGIFINTGTATSNIEYNTLTELVGLCRLSSSNNWHIIHNDASGTATTIDLGSNFIATNENIANSLITFRIIATSATTCTVRVTNAAGLVHEEIITSDLPDLDSLHTVKGMINNNANAVTYMVDYHDAVELFK